MKLTTRTLLILLAISVLGNLLGLAVAYKAWVWRSALHGRTAELSRTLDKWNAERQAIEAADAVALANLGCRPDALLFGASIERSWDLGAAFPGRSYVNRGINGETSAEMLDRFERSVVALRPRVLVIGGGGGINRIGSGEDCAVVAGTIAGHTREMVQRARAAGIRVILLSILPTGRLAQGAYRRNEQVAKANDLLRQLAAADPAGVRFVDVATLVSGPDGQIRDDLVKDGLHPNDAGYKIMTEAVRPVLEEMVASARQAEAAPAAAAAAPGAEPAPPVAP